MIQSKLAAKKRLMFIKSEDFNFIAYNALVMLNSLECYSETKSFVDYKKLAFLIDFTADWRLTGILHRSIKLKSAIDDASKHRLFRLYSSASRRIPMLSKIIYALKMRNIIGVAENSNTETTDIYLKDKESIANFCAQNIFNAENHNFKTVRTCLPQLRIMNREKMVSKIFCPIGSVICPD